MTRILGLGGVTTDQIGVVDHIPGSDEVIRLQRYRVEQGGMIATALAAAARLGAEAEFLGGLGDDANGRYALDRLAAGAVDARSVRIFPGGISAFSFILVERDSGKRTIVHEPGVQRNRSLDIPKGNLPALLAGVGYLHLDGFWMDTAVEIAETAKSKGITITLDIGQNQRDPKIEILMGLADYVIPSLPFARRFTGFQQVEKSANALLRYGAEAVIQTLGEQGVFVLTRDGRRFTVPAFEVPVVDTTGAGDSFHGGFVFALSRGYTLEEAVTFASAVAALKCTHLGGRAGLPSFPQVRDFLVERSILLP
jgi:sugar/nucleoside kinase (ribokinase family)